MVALELEFIAKKYDRFGWDRDRGSASHNRMMSDWIDCLCDFPLSEIQAACREAVKSNPNKMPNEGHIVQQIQKQRARVVQDRMQSARVNQSNHDARMPWEVKPPRLSPEAANAIIQEAGIRLKTPQGATK